MKHFGYKCDKKEHWEKNSKFFILIRKVTANKSLIVKMNVLEYFESVSPLAAELHIRLWPRWFIWVPHLDCLTLEDLSLKLELFASSLFIP